MFNYKILILFVAMHILSCQMFIHRHELVRSSDWLTYGESGRVPSEGENVFVRYNLDNKWYRGFIDEVKQVRVGSV